MAKGERVRLDVLLTERGLAESRRRAQGLILAGAVTVNGVNDPKASTLVDGDADIQVRVPEDEPVSRGSHKLEAALATFDIDVSGKIAVDVGASTGGFTDVLLRRGAAKVYAVDVGYGQLSWRLREDERVVAMERTNFRTVESLPEAPEVAAVDVSFISLGLIFPALFRVTAPGVDAVVLIKPQFEAGKDRVGKGGVVRDPLVHRDVLGSVVSAAHSNSWGVKGLMVSPLLGPAGNREFLAHLQRDADSATGIDKLIVDLTDANA